MLATAHLKGYPMNSRSVTDEARDLVIPWIAPVNTPCGIAWIAKPPGGS